MFTPLAVANALILKGERRSPMGLNKLVYMVHGWALAWDKPSLGEMPEIWKYGPIYRSLYEALHAHKNQIIREPQPARGMTSTHSVPPADALMDVITWVQGRYAQFSDTDLSSLAHADGSPWKLEAAARNFEVPLGTVVPEWRMRSHFVELRETVFVEHKAA